MRKSECGMRNGGFRSRNLECGLRPLRAVGSIYEPEAIGVYVYAPEGMRNRLFGLLNAKFQEFCLQGKGLAVALGEFIGEF